MSYQHFSTEVSSHSLRESGGRIAPFQPPEVIGLRAQFEISSATLGVTTDSIGLSAAQRTLFFLVIIQSALLPLVPDELTIQSAGFAVTFAVLWIVSLGSATIASTGRWAGIALGLFLVSVFVSYPTAVGNGIPSFEWLRACIPFLFLSAYFVLGTAKGEADSLFILDCLQIGALFWAAKILFLSAGNLNSLLSGSLARLTYVTLDTLIPFGFLGFVLSLYNPSPFATRYRAAFLTLFGFLVLACAYRSQIILCTAVVIIHPRIRRHLLAAGLVLLLLMAPLSTLIAVSDLPLMSNITLRFERLSEIRDFDDLGTRAHELRFAYTSFLDSPIFGNGLGCPVPGVYTGDSDYYRSIHNVWLYLLMDLGLIGCCFYVLFILASLGTNDRNESSPKLEIYARARWCAKLATGALLLYASCQAAYRGIQFNLMLAAMTAVATTPFSAQCARSSFTARETP